ncbi:hypothetical protein [Myroides odoratus]|uniref:Uncharacterized protein n=1 Tax=Myroides odoratus TaxID=256 RepID=A0A9Q7E9I3_MYROD|nr:hypothetical protein [Myroides odoratus]EHQ43899.1 hypothetical protein Myrod_3081 [Myroides odoratus DSM 2801]EKB04984.1 hypothetical protein HMPREF9716_03015 [Myroides odoratus CIP 103059]QQU01202.1 hypothetical protein I6I88_05475 [Myroides odoratus]WQD56540.1 hypothetical protein U0010_13555 [Myroides odoratus]STZ31175.1 Uncharacterised protein [Myroides odoratus]
MNNKVFYLIISLFIFSFSFSQQKTIDKKLFSEVVAKLEDDKKSFEIFSNLYQEYILDLSEEGHKEHFLDLYIQLYNEGFPMVRLLKIESLSKAFDQLIKRDRTDYNVRLYKAFLKLIRNKKNYSTDIDIGAQGEQKQYFLKFLNEYKIVPETN